jgi:hypothetical protein
MTAIHSPLVITNRLGQSQATSAVCIDSKNARLPRLPMDIVRHRHLQGPQSFNKASQACQEKYCRGVSQRNNAAMQKLA